MMWFIERMGMIFAKKHSFKEQKLKRHERYETRLRIGRIVDLMKSTENRLSEYSLSDDAGLLWAVNYKSMITRKI